MNEADLAFAGVARQVDLLAAREVSAGELVSRIEELDGRIGAFTKVLPAPAPRPRAQRVLEAGRRSPLLGVPIDNVDVAGELTSHGTGAAGGPAEADSEVVRRLRAAGAVIVGKTALPELAQCGHFTDTVTWGTTRNPRNSERSPGGSSGGSAAAVAAGLPRGPSGRTAAPRSASPLAPAASSA